jgi:hypothetical protein
LPAQAFALPTRGKFTQVYAPKGGTVRLDLTKTDATFKFRWFNARTGKWVEGGTVSGGGQREFEAPDESDWVLLVQQVKNLKCRGDGYGALAGIGLAFARKHCCRSKSRSQSFF